MSFSKQSAARLIDEREIYFAKLAKNCVDRAATTDLKFDRDEKLTELELLKTALAGEWDKRSGEITGIALLLARTIALLFLVLERLKGGSTDLAGERRAVAVHSEWTNRTRHVWEEVSGDNCQVLLLGRRSWPWAERALRSKLNANGIKTSGLTFINPVLRAGLISGFVGRWRQSSRVAVALNCFAKASGSRPSVKCLTGIFFRIHLGHEYARWVSFQKRFPEICIFGHTGTADSSGLDLALQEYAVETVHWFHGLSSGMNFLAFSTVAVCTSGIDQKIYQSLGCYRRVELDPALKPELSVGEGEWCLFTNYLHPQNKELRSSGAQDELCALQIVSDVALKNKSKGSRLIWRPHPTIKSVPENLAAHVINAAKKMNYEIWKGFMDKNRLKKFEMVFCTRSTIIIDLLKNGLVPIVIVNRPGFDVLLANLPAEILASSGPETAAAVNRISDANERRNLFDDCWAQIQPGSGKLPLRYGALKDSSVRAAV